MNYIRHLTGFFDKVADDKSLNPSHISLYMSIFQFWNCNRFRNPISISRDEIMRISKISSKATYHKCLKALHSMGYLKYEPSYNPFRGSHVIMFDFSDYSSSLFELENTDSPFFEPVTKQGIDRSNTGKELEREQLMVPYINKSNNTNYRNNLKVLKKDQNSEDTKVKLNIYNSDGTVTPKEKISAKKEKVVNPTVEKIKNYFLKEQFPELEAIRFFNYFSSNGWLVGGKTPMVDWHAAAQNWMINAPNFKKTANVEMRSQQLNTGADKDYTEPL